MPQDKVIYHWNPRPGRLGVETVTGIYDILVIDVIEHAARRGLAHMVRATNAKRNG